MADPNRQSWNQHFKKLQDTWPKPLEFDKCIAIFLDLHGMVHGSPLTDSGLHSFEDELWEQMSEKEFRSVYENDNSIAWKLWHTARIEDVTMNILIANRQQIFTAGGFQVRMGVKAANTGNEMSRTEIEDLSKSIDIHALKEYRLAVGLKTRDIVRELKPEDLKRKIEASRLQRIFDEGAVGEDAQWLLDYWGKKTYSGLLLMPASRHNLVHLNQAIRLLGKGKKHTMKRPPK